MLRIKILDFVWPSWIVWLHDFTESLSGAFTELLSNTNNQSLSEVENDVFVERSKVRFVFEDFNSRKTDLA